MQRSQREAISPDTVASYFEMNSSNAITSFFKLEIRPFFILLTIYLLFIDTGCGVKGKPLGSESVTPPSAEVVAFAAISVGDEDSFYPKVRVALVNMGITRVHIVGKPTITLRGVSYYCQDVPTHDVVPPVKSDLNKDEHPEENISNTSAKKDENMVHIVPVKIRRKPLISSWGGLRCSEHNVRLVIGQNELQPFECVVFEWDASGPLGEPSPDVLRVNVEFTYKASDGSEISRSSLFCSSPIPPPNIEHAEPPSPL